MSGWQTIAVNGALADALVIDLTTQPSPFSGMPLDCRLCIIIDYAAAAATQVRLWLATGAGVAPELTRIVYDSAFQTNPGADQTQFIPQLCRTVPLAPGTNNWLSLRITKAATNARIDIYTEVKMGPGC